MVTSKDNYYTEMCNTLTDYNNRNHMPLSNANIQEAIRKFVEYESIKDDKNITVDTFSHVYNAHRENESTIFSR